MENEPHLFSPNRFVDDLETFAEAMMYMIENNGRTELNDEGAPMFQSYGPATLAAFASALAYAKLLKAISSCIFQLNQGDFSEQVFHREIENALDMMDEEADSI
jgi:hypothetical protein